MGYSCRTLRLSSSSPILRVLQLYYKVASSQLPAPQILRFYSCTTRSPVLSFQLHRLLRALKLYYKVASSQLPAPQIAPRTKVVLQSRQCSPAFRARHARSPQRVARAPDKSHSRLRFAHSTRTISAEGCARMGQIALSPAFRALDTHDLRRVARAWDKSRSRLHFAHSTRTISAEGCARMGQIALSPAFRTLDTHDLRRGVRVKSPKRAFRTRLPQKLTRQSLQNERFVRDFLQKSSGNTHRSTHITQPCQAVSRFQPLQTTSAHTAISM